MSTVVIRRSPRRPEPEIPTGELAVEAPPEIPQATGARWQQLLMVLPMLGGSVAMAMMMGGQGTGPRAYSYVVGGLFGISSLAMLATSFGSSGSPKKAEMMAARREYLRHLANLRRRVRQTADRQRAGLFYRHPEPGQLWATVASHRLWEPRAADPDFAVVRGAGGGVGGGGSRAGGARGARPGLGGGGGGGGPAAARDAADPAGDAAAGGPRADDRGRAAALPGRVLRRAGPARGGVAARVRDGVRARWRPRRRRGRAGADPRDAAPA